MQSSRGSDTGGRPPGQDPRAARDDRSGREPEEQAHGTPAEAEAARSDGGGGDGQASRMDLSEEIARIEDRYRRALADLDNYRKRATREVDRRVAEAREAALHDWLQVVDSVERAVAVEPGGPCEEGLQAVLQQIDAVLDRQGAVRIGAPGDRFDPERHEAVAVRASGEVPERTVVEVQRSGVARGDRVIRPAQVVVARAPEHAH
ncbi:MAG TPA: nucleotide exchange factor GrpE [Solirubrobacteraceae bacterium]|jgi:molecular chaperone GrpE|nr:nucleotide exchange factor GrpE [Solirubrobacteraceae bacterium]